MQTKSAHFNCESSYRQKIIGSLEYFRLNEVCRIEIFPKTAQTDNMGIVTLSNTVIKRGPQGSYGYKFSSISNPEAQTPENFIFVNSQVASFEILTSPPKIQKVGVPFDPQPKVKILDYFSEPMKGKKIIAVTWPEPILKSKFGQSVYYDAVKFGLLEGDVSLESNDEGIAEFKNLTIIGSTYEYLYIYFVCENNGEIVWINYTSPLFIEEHLPFYARPIQIESDVYSVEVKVQPNLKIKEGEIINKNNNSMKILVKDKDDKPIKNKLVFIMIAQYNEQEYHFNYKRKESGSINKDLIKPFPGVYKELSPFSEEKEYIPILTDINGSVIFNETYFSIYGPTGFYVLSFVCDGVVNYSRRIEVTTSVRYIRFITQPPVFFDFNTMNLDRDFVVTIMISNEKKNPVFGKTVNLDIINSITLSELSYSEFGLKLNKENPNFSYSDKYGILRLYFHFSNSKEIMTFIKLKISIEGLSLNSREIKFSFLKTEKRCSELSLLSIKSPKLLRPGDSISMKFRIRNNFNESSELTYFMLDVDYISDSLTNTPHSMIPTSSVGKYLSFDNPDGEIFNYKIQEWNGGYYKLKPIAFMFNLEKAEGEMNNTQAEQAYNQWENYITNRYSGDTEEIENFYRSLNYLESLKIITYVIGEPINFHVRTLVKYIEILSDLPNIFEFDKNYTITVQILNRNKKPVSNYTVNIVAKFLQTPSYLLKNVFNNVKSLHFAQQSNKSDINGMLNLSIVFKPSYFGLYIISLLSEGVSSLPIEIMIINPVEKIYLIDQPIVNYTVNNTENMTEIISTYQRAGDYLGRFSVKALGIGGIPLKNIPIGVNIIGEASFDILEAYEDSEFLGTSKEKISFTNEEGIAFFDEITSYSINEKKECVKFQFFSVDAMNYRNSQIILSENFTNIHCFYDLTTVQINQNSYSKEIVSGAVFSKPLEVKINKPYITDSDVFSSGHIMIFLHKIFDKRIKYPLKISDITKNMCGWQISQESSKYGYPYQDILFLPKVTKDFKIKIKNYEELYKIAESHSLTTYLKKYGNLISKKQFLQLNSLLKNYSKDFNYEVKIIFDGLKWVGSPLSSFKLSANTMSSFPSDEEETGEVISINTLIGLLSGKSIGNGLALKIATEKLEEINTMKHDLQNIMSLEPDQIIEYKDKITNIFGNVIATTKFLQNLIYSDKKYDITRTIHVSNQIKALEFVISPPENVFIGDQFQIIVRAKQSNGVNSAGTNIIANVIPENPGILGMGFSDIQTIITQLGNGKFSMKSLNEIAQRKSNIAINSENSIEKTDLYGIATFNLVFTEGMSGNYIIALSCGSLKIKTSKINVINPIAAVSFANNISQKLSILDSPENKLNSFFYLKIQPIIEIKYQKESNNLPKKIEFRVYKSEDVQNLVSNLINITNKTYLSIEYLLDQQTSNKSFSMGSTMQVIKNIWDATTQAGNVIKVIKRKDEGLSYFFDGYEESIDNKLYFKKFSLQLKIFAKYRLLAIVNGVESNLSEEIVLESIPSNYESLLYTIAIIIFVYMFMSILCIMCSNGIEYTARYNVYAIIFLILWLPSFTSDISNYDNETKILMLTICILLLILSIESIINLYLKKSHLFSNAKDIIYEEYTYQRLFRKQSPTWMNKYGSIAQIQIGLDKKDYHKKSIKEKIKEIILPFEFYLKKPNLLDYDPIFYPQLFSACILCSITSVGYISYKSLVFLLKLQNNLYELNFKVFDFYLEFVNKGLTYMKSYGSGILPINEESFTQFLTVINFIQTQFNAIRRSFQISFLVAWVIAIFLFIGSIISIFFDFKSRIVAMRKGKMKFDAIKILFNNNSTRFVGLTISNYIVGFVVFLFIFGFVTFPFYWPLFWLLIYKYINYIIALIAFPIAKAVVILIAKQICLSQKSIKHRKFLGILDFILIYIGIGAGIFPGILRFIISIILTSFSLFSITDPILPAWTLKLIFMDVVCRTYYGFVYRCYIHNNPIVNTFCKLISKDINQSLKLNNNNIKKKIANRIYLYLFLNKYSKYNFGQYRKKIIKRSLNWEDKILKKSESLCTSNDLAVIKHERLFSVNFIKLNQDFEKNLKIENYLIANEESIKNSKLEEKKLKH